MDIVKLNALNRETEKKLRASLSPAGFDMARLYTVEEAACLYHILTRACVPGILEFVNSLELPTDTVLTLSEISKIARNQEGCALFTASVGLSINDDSNENIFGRITIPASKEGKRDYENDYAYSKTTIHQDHGRGSVKNFVLHGDVQLTVEVLTNSDLLLQNISSSGNVDIHITTAELVQAGIKKDESAKKDNAIRTSMNREVKISISSCVRALFGICAGTINVDQVSTCRVFALHAIEFNTIQYRQSTCSDATIYVPKNTKFHLEVADGCDVDCPDILKDKTSSKVIKILQVSTGKVWIKEEE